MGNTNVFFENFNRTFLFLILNRLNSNRITSRKNTFNFYNSSHLLKVNYQSFYDPDHLTFKENYLIHNRQLVIFSPNITQYI